MSKKCDTLKQVRMDPKNYSKLVEIVTACPWKVTLMTVANFAIRNGIAKARKVFSGAK